MAEFPAELLASWTGGRWTAQPVSSLSGFTIDSRQVRAGQVFVALKTPQRDGHAFVRAAAAAGAGAALVATPEPEAGFAQLVVPDPLAAFQAIAREHRRRFAGPVIGVTGSAGKTSTKNLLALLLGGEAGGVLATEGNLNNHLGVPLTLTRLDPARHRCAVIEAGISAPGEMATLAAMIEPDVAILTLVAAAHTAELGGLEGVAREKAVLPAAVRAGGVAIFPRQSAGFRALAELGGRRLVVERVDAIPATPAPDEVFFTVAQCGEATAITLAQGAAPPLAFTLRRVSAGMAQNAALAISAALWLGVSRDAIQARLAEWTPASLRGEVRREGGRLLYLDCYNANPASMADALDAFYALAPAEPRLLVLGGMEELGPEAEMYHRALGRSLRLREPDRAFVVGEHAAAVRTGALESGARPEQVRVIAAAEEAADAVAAWRGAVFIKGSRRYALERILTMSETAGSQAAATPAGTKEAARA